MDGSMLWHMVVHAGWVVQLILIALISFSVLSWAVIVQRYCFFRQARQWTTEFEDCFWSSSDIHAMYAEVNKKRHELFGLEHIFYAGFQEFLHMQQHESAHGPGFVAVERRMRATASREQDRLEHHLSFLATVGSTSPYMGLFGTVWGLIATLGAFGLMQDLTLNDLAPGVSEAMIATALGLFAAIPAVMAFHVFTHQVERFASLYHSFQEEFLSILHREYQQVQNAKGDSGVHS